MNPEPFKTICMLRPLFCFRHSYAKAFHNPRVHTTHRDNRSRANAFNLFFKYPFSYLGMRLERRFSRNDSAMGEVSRTDNEPVLTFCVRSSLATFPARK